MSAEDEIRTRLVTLGNMVETGELPNRYSENWLITKSLGPKTPLVQLGTEALYGAWTDLRVDSKPAIRSVLSDYELDYRAYTRIPPSPTKTITPDDIEKRRLEVDENLKGIVESLDGSEWQIFYQALKAIVIHNTGRRNIEKVHELNHFMGYAILSETSGLLRAAS